MMMGALRDGFGSLARNWGLVLVVLAVNLSLALVLAVPLALQLEDDLTHTGASSSMMYGFDYEWWSAWSEDQEGLPRTFEPSILGVGFAARNVDLLARGFVPAGLFPEGTPRDGDGDRRFAQPGVDPLILGVGVLYLLVQVFLTGGILGVFRAPQGGWTVRGLVHGSGFYFARLVRVSLLALVLAAFVFALNVPFARWVDGLGREAVSERTALVLGLGRHAALLLALLLVHMVASFARAIVVLEERRSAALALLSSAGFCVRNLLAAVGQYVVLVATAVLLLALWSVFDVRFPVTGWKSQMVVLVVFQAFVTARISLRLGLLASQLELYRARRAGKAAPDRV